VRTWAEHIDGAIQSAGSWIAVSAISAILWLVRRIFTNQKQIELLSATLALREDERARDREDLQEVKTDVKELRGDIKTLLIRRGDDAQTHQ